MPTAEKVRSERERLTSNALPCPWNRERERERGREGEGVVNNENCENCFLDYKLGQIALNSLIKNEFDLAPCKNKKETILLVNLKFVTLRPNC